MGSLQSTQNTKSGALDHVKINHPRFAQFVNGYNSHHQSCLEVKIPIESKKAYQDWEKALQHAPHDHDDFLMPHQIHLHQEGICGSMHYVNAFYDKFYYILSDEIKSRSLRGQKGYFTEAQLWYLVYTLVSGASDFHARRLKVGDIRPQNVFLNNDGRIKITTFLSWPDQKVNYQKTFYQNQITYLAPEEIKDLKLFKEKSQSDPIRSQSFSVGLTCLSAAILKSSEQLYLKNYCFNYHELSIKLAELKSKNYSPILIKIICDLCNTDPLSRNTCTQIFKFLQPYEQIINNLQRFQIRRPENRPQNLTNSLPNRLYSNKQNLPIQISANNPQRSNLINETSSLIKPFFLIERQKDSPSKQTNISTPMKSQFSYHAEEYKNNPYAYSSTKDRFSSPQQIKYQNTVPQTLNTKSRESIQQTLAKIDQQLEYSRKTFTN